jgi:hypothetical protein
MQKIELENIANQYQQACQAVPKMLAISGRTNVYFYTRMPISKSTFEQRLRDGRWKPDELRLLGELL